MKRQVRACDGEVGVTLEVSGGNQMGARPPVAVELSLRLPSAHACCCYAGEQAHREK